MNPTDVRVTGQGPDLIALRGAINGYLALRDPSQGVAFSNGVLLRAGPDEGGVWIKADAGHDRVRVTPAGDGPTDTAVVAGPVDWVVRADWQASATTLPNVYPTRPPYDRRSPMTPAEDAAWRTAAKADAHPGGPMPPCGHDACRGNWWPDEPLFNDDAPSPDMP